MLFPENMGPHLAIDETSLSNGKLYTFVTNHDACTRECSLVAAVAGTKSEDVIAVLQRIDEESRYAVKEVTLVLSDSMRKIVRTAFPKAGRVIDRFHIQKLACDAVQELRIKHCWDAIQQANEEWRKQNRTTKIISHTDIPMVILVGNCLYVLGICFSSQPINGQKDRNKEQPSYLKNILISRKHMVCAIPCG